jgi:iron(III) transport system substrate-binding protein
MPSDRVRGAARAARAVASLVALTALAGCGDSPSVTVYTSADQEEVARPVFERFERETGIRVDAKFDTEATKTTALANALRSERARPRADVFWSNEQAANVALGAEGVTAPLEPGPADAALATAVASWPPQWRDPSGRWFAFAGRARVIVHHPGRVPSPPTSWQELGDPAWKGRIAMADPRFGTTRSHFGAMEAAWDASAPGAFDDFMARLVANEPKVLTSGNAGVVDAVARGEADLGMTDTDDVLAAQARGLQVAMVMPRHLADPSAAGGGTYVIPNTVAIVAGAPHPDEARRFVAFMLDAATERQLATVAARHVPLVHPSGEGDLSVPDALRVDPAAVAANADAAVERFFAARRAAGQGN